jgi:large subunit ribosomal protein L25
MEVGKLSAAYRPSTKKTATNKLRAEGKIPAVCYGMKAEPLSLAVDPTLLLKSLDPVKKSNTVLELVVSGTPQGDEKLTVMLRDYQKDPIRGDLIHADFIRVDLNKEVHATVPIVLVGKAPGVVNGGLMNQVIRVLEIACLPQKIPVKCEVDVSKLEMGEALHVRDLKLGEGVRALVEAGGTVCSVTAPKAEKVEEVAAPVEGAAAEGAAAAPGAPGAPAAAGAAPGKEGAAPAAAKGGAPAKEGGAGKKK